MGPAFATREPPIRFDQVNPDKLEDQITAAADQCVKCGLCIPHCPTYRELRDESESPRGRIALAQGLAEGRLPPRSPRLQRHLGNCLECSACEVACPSLVRFGQIMDDARALTVRTETPRGRLVKRGWLALLSGNWGVQAGALLASLYRATGASRLARLAGLERLPRPWAYHRIALQLRRPWSSPREEGPPVESGEHVALFAGCVGRAAQPQVLDAALSLLHRLGLRTGAFDSLTCCGAMHRHNGFPEQADRLLARNAAALGGTTPVGVASACVAELRTHQDLRHAQEICRFLAGVAWPQGLSLRPLEERVAVHLPCSQRNLLRDSNAADDLLARIPGIQLVPLPDNASCCGAAGTYLLANPVLSRRLLEPKLEQLARLGVGTLVTTNTGCALHLTAGIREAGLEVRVLHPVELIERQLTPSEDVTKRAGHG